MVDYEYIFNADELSLLLDALTKGASSHQSEAKYYPRTKKLHKDKALAMNKLKVRIMRLLANKNWDADVSITS